MTKFPITVTLVCCIIALAGTIGFCAVGALRPLTCHFTGFVNGVYKDRDVPCLRVGNDVRGGSEDTPAPTATGYYYTPEPTEIEPTATAEPTGEPYPIGTPTIIDPYPEPRLR